MVELGDAHDAEHARLGELAGKTADIILAVVPDRIRSFIDAASKGHALVIEVPNFQTAQNWLMENQEARDVVLLENDLPDLFEKQIRL